MIDITNYLRNVGRKSEHVEVDIRFTKQELLELLNVFQSEQWQNLEDNLLLDHMVFELKSIVSKAISQ